MNDPMVMDKNIVSIEGVEERLQKYGYNEIMEKNVHPLRRFLSYFWGPIPWMIKVVAIFSMVVQHWVDFSIIVALLIFNAGLEFWRGIIADELVPGDIVRLRLGDVINQAVMEGSTIVTKLLATIFTIKERIR
ncbi:MAG: hypothetical protein SYNGOMJ08_00582 [Candidatus Syntrophoarchaeum sp. GoM_oil]|nr:MAG: hypothetical protein SYNGOMJ08_00582 [Candidatus Syntrophoarchaeum sp. GoM_oil]